MKAKKMNVPVEPQFQPFKIELLVESAKEQAVLYTLFNHAVLAEFMIKHGFPYDHVRQTIEINSEVNNVHSDLHSRICQYGRQR